MNLRPMPAAVVLFVAFGASAQPASVTNSRMVPAQVQPSADAVLDERQARDWGLHPEEWARYRQLMQGPLGVYSPALDPLTALGIEARSEEERRRYAELQVRAEPGESARHWPTSEPTMRRGSACFPASRA